MMKSTFRMLFKKNHPSDAVPQGYVSFYYEPSLGGFVTKDDSGTVTPLSATDGATLTNVLLSSYSEKFTDLGLAPLGSTAFDLANGTMQKILLRASTNVDIYLPSAEASEGKSITLIVQQAAVTGGGTIGFVNAVFGDAGTPIQTPAVNKIDIYTFVCDGTNWYGSVSQGY